jgi:hypothetical protein
MSSTKSWINERKSSVSQAVRRMSGSAKDMFGIAKMDKRERHQFRRERHSQSDDRPSFPSQPSSPGPLASPSLPGKPLPAALSKTEKFALGLSEAIDPMKTLRRPGTADSDMSFGMTDVAPAGAMNECSGCGMPTYEYLKGGRCKDCQALAAKLAKEKAKGK